MSNEQIEFDEENESDIAKLGPRDVGDAVVYSSDWTTETLLAQLDRGNITINPRFQRRDAWAVSRKSRFIESLVLGLPIPQIVLAEQKGERGKYIVLDGKQRLLALQQFAGRGEGPNNNFPLTALDVRKDLSGKTHRDLVNDAELQVDRGAFENQTIRTMVIRGWPHIDFLHLVFVRLNTGSVSLSPQELRQALFPGPFVDYADDFTVQSQGLRRLLRTDTPDFRMRDVEMFVRFAAFGFFFEEYRGNMKAFLDSTCEQLNQGWEAREAAAKAMAADFENALGALFEIFGNDVGKKWNESGPERSLNRAVLDVQLYYFAMPAVRDAALLQPQEVSGAFRDLSVGSATFRGAVEATTKSLTATTTRFSEWGRILNTVLGVAVPIPELNDGKIVLTQV